MLVVDATEPQLSVIEVTLIPGGVAAGILDGTHLDAGIGGGATGDAVLEGEVEVGDSPLPVEEFIFAESASFGNGSGDRSVFDAPDLGVALPLVEAFVIEEREGSGDEGQGGG